jgi:hypothetical protein
MDREIACGLYTSLIKPSFDSSHDTIISVRWDDGDFCYGGVVWEGSKFSLVTNEYRVSVIWFTTLWLPLKFLYG